MRHWRLPCLIMSQRISYIILIEILQPGREKGVPDGNAYDQVSFY